jgi:2-C-methyl-D-erythritol 4-phosphate cytidylyltransferase
MIYCVLLAGGTGKRMKNAKLPKQFLDLKGKPVIIRTIERVQQFSFIDQIIIAIHPDWKDYLDELLEKYQIEKESITVVDGGKERINSIVNSMAAISQSTISEDDVVIIHDAVRPFVSEPVMSQCVDAARAHGAALATIPAQDTMLYSAEGIMVEDIPIRAHLFNGQAPDAIRLKEFSEIVNNLTPENIASNFGTVQLSRLGGLNIVMVPSSSRNIKITTDEDLELAQLLVEYESK